MRGPEPERFNFVGAGERRLGFRVGKSEVHTPAHTRSWAPTVDSPTIDAVLEGMARSRILEAGWHLELRLPTSATKAVLARRVADARVPMRRLLPLLRRDELRDACRAFDLDAELRARSALIAQIAEAAGESVADLEDGSRPADALPQPDDLVVVRQRQYLVESVTPSVGVKRPGRPRQATRVSLVCLDDDAQGKPLEVLWELELGARIVEPARGGLGEVDEGEFASMHAKCVVIDGREALATSANFTGRAQTRNFEVGALIDDPVFARAPELHWKAEIDVGPFTPFGPG